MSAWAKPGVKCVCVDAAKGTMKGHDPLNGFPVEGAIYTVKAVGPFRPFFEGVTLQIVELPNPSIGDGKDCGWHPRRFRPLITLDQDIALFAHHLDGVGVPA